MKQYKHPLASLLFIYISFFVIVLIGCDAEVKIDSQPKPISKSETQSLWVLDVVKQNEFSGTVLSVKLDSNNSVQMFETCDRSPMLRGGHFKVTFHVDESDRCYVVENSVLLN